MSAILVAVIAAVAAVLVLLEPVAPTPSRLWSGAGALVGLCALLIVGVALVSGLNRIVPMLLAVASLWAGRALWLRGRADRDERDVAERVREACQQLASELGAGQPSGAALDRAAADWPTLAPVAEALRVGADVPAALRAGAAQPGAQDLRLLAAAWQVAHRTGQGLAAAVDRVALDLVAARRTRRLVDGELAAARATARLVAGLPVLAWMMGSSAGGAPVSFLIDTPLGWGCLALGLTFGAVGLWWIEAIARGVDRSR